MRDLPRGTQVADHGARSLSPTGLSPSLACRSRHLRLAIEFVTPQGPCRAPMICSYNPNSETAATYRAELVWTLPVSLATTKGMFSFPPATEMFQFAGFASWTYVFSPGSPLREGLPHSETCGSTGARPSPQLFAACHVLHRLLAPRHPPDALLLRRSIRSLSPPRTGATATRTRRHEDRLSHEDTLTLGRTLRPSARSQ